MGNIFKNGDLVEIKSWEELLAEGRWLGQGDGTQDFEDFEFGIVRLKDYTVFPEYMRYTVFPEYMQYLCGRRFVVNVEQMDLQMGTVGIINGCVISSSMVKLVSLADYCLCSRCSHD